MPSKSTADTDLEPTTSFPGIGEVKSASAGHTNAEPTQTGQQADLRVAGIEQRISGLEQQVTGLHAEARDARQGTAGSRLKRFVVHTLVLALSAGGAFGGGYFVMQTVAQEQILVLEQQVVELETSRERANRVELDLTGVFEPIREAVGRVALVKLDAISKQITTELVQVLEADLQELGESPTLATLMSMSEELAEPSPVLAEDRAGGLGVGSAARDPAPTVIEQGGRGAVNRDDGAPSTTEGVNERVSSRGAGPDKWLSVPPPVSDDRRDDDFTSQDADSEVPSRAVGGTALPDSELVSKPTTSNVGPGPPLGPASFQPERDDEVTNPERTTRVIRMPYGTVGLDRNGSSQQRSTQISVPPNRAGSPRSPNESHEAWTTQHSENWPAARPYR